MKGYKNKVIASALSAIILFAVSISPAFAWKSLDTLFGDSSDTNLLADSWDVVTTDKWNALAGIVTAVYRTLIDFPRWSTPFVDLRSNVINGMKGVFFQGIGLWYSAGWRAPHISFYNADTAFDKMVNVEISKNLSATRKGPRGMIQFAPKEFWYDDSLLFGGFEGGLKIIPGADSYTADSNGKSYTIGWEKISLTDTSAFDPLCQYRFQTNYTDRFYYPPTVQLYHLWLAEVADWGNDLAELRYLEIFNGAKTSLRHKASGWLSFPSHGATVTRIEKNCAPAYNPGNF